MVDKLDISNITAEYKGGGTTDFAPRIMIKVLFYSYLSNVSFLVVKLPKHFMKIYIDQQIQQDNQGSNQQEIPQKIDSNLLKEKLGESNQKLKESSKSTQKQIEKLQNEHLPRLEKYEQQLQTLGDRNSFSKTDEDATFMRMKEDHIKNGRRLLVN